MSTDVYDTKEAQQKQGVSFEEQEWLRLQQHLPADWQEQAISKNAWTRTRNLRSIADLLRALLVYAACGFSFRQLGIWGTLTGLASLSERAWRKRLTTASPWIDGLVATLIGPGCTPAWLPKTHGGRILLIDGTCLKMPAGKGNDSKLHTAYDLHAGRLAQVRLTPREGAEGIHHFELQPQDVTVTDAGYHLGSSFAQEHQQGAYGVHRFSAHQERLEQENGKKLDLKRLVKHQKYGTVTHWKAYAARADLDPAQGSVSSIPPYFLSVIPSGSVSTASLRRMPNGPCRACAGSSGLNCTWRSMIAANCWLVA